MVKAHYLSGKTFGRLTVISRAANSKFGKAQWLCRCSCGNTKTILAQCLRLGYSKSCGCLRADSARENFTAHGLYGSPSHRVWMNMLNRCRCPDNPGYKNYGGRGIKVCDRWLSFENFYADMGERPEGKSLDRINNNGDYEPNNCRWASRTEQSLNSRRPKLLTHRGITDSESGWAKRLGLSPSSLHERLARGWPLDVALSTKRTHKSRSPVKD